MPSSGGFGVRPCRTRRYAHASVTSLRSRAASPASGAPRSLRNSGDTAASMGGSARRRCWSPCSERAWRRQIVRRPMALEFFRYFGEAVALLDLVLLYLVAAWSHPLLPDRVPRHFNLRGEPDAWATQDQIWLLPVAAFLL